jgi:hypothetical protein
MNNEHRELYRFFSVGDVVAVELALQGIVIFAQLGVLSNIEEALARA